MKDLLLILCLLFQMGTLVGQELSLISGQVQSVLDGSPIRFANLYLNSNRGTSSDEDGFYEFRFSNSTVDTILKVSAIGFKTKKVPLSALISNPTITLEEAIFSLDEVVVTPLNAFPIIKESTQKNKSNYKTDWLAARIRATQTLFVEYDSVPNKKLFLGTMNTSGTLNFKGYTAHKLAIQIDTIETTADFIQFDTIKKPPFGADPIALNLYDFFDRYEFSGLAKRGRGFLLNKDFSKNYRKVIDFKTIDGRKHYLIKTKPAKGSTQSYSDVEDLKRANEQARTDKKRLAANARAFGQNQVPITDAVLTDILQKSQTYNELLGYAWIDYEDYGVRRLFYKGEWYNQGGNPFNRSYRDICYKRFDNRYVPEKIEVLLKAFSLNGTHIYRYVKIEFNAYRSGSDFDPIPKEDTLEGYLYWEDPQKQFPLDTETAKKDFSRLKYQAFLKPLRKTSHSALDDFLDRIP